MADLTLDLQVSLSWGVIAESFHSLQSLSVRCFQVILGLPGPHFPTICMSKAVLTAPLEHSTCPYQQSLLSFSMRSRSSMPSRASAEGLLSFFDGTQWAIFIVNMLTTVLYQNFLEFYLTNMLRHQTLKWEVFFRIYRRHLINKTRYLDEKELWKSNVMFSFFCDKIYMPY